MLEDRLSILVKNKTTGGYQYCPDMQPYFDDITCIYCEEQFNLDTKKCVSAPSGLAYDKNIRKYIVPEANKETNPNSPNYITQRLSIVDSP